MATVRLTQFVPHNNGTVYVEFVDPADPNGMPEGQTHMLADLWDEAERVRNAQNARAVLLARVLLRSPDPANPDPAPYLGADFTFDPALDPAVV